MDLADGGGQGAAHALDVVEQAAAVALAQPHLPGEIAVGDGAHRLGGVARVAAQGAGHAADHHHHQQAHRHADDQQGQQGAGQRGDEGGIDVVDVDAGADDPAPGGEALVVGGLRDGLAALLVLPEVVDVAVVPGDVLGELAEQVAVLDVLEVAHLGAHRQAGVAQQGVVVVEDVEVAAPLVVAHGLDQRGGLGLGRLGVELAGGDPLGLALEGRHRQVDVDLERRAALVEHGLAGLPGVPADHQQHGQPDESERSPQLLCCCQLPHCAVPSRVVGSSSHGWRRARVTRRRIRPGPSPRWSAACRCRPAPACGPRGCPGRSGSRRRG